MKPQSKRKLNKGNNSSLKSANKLSKHTQDKVPRKGVSKYVSKSRPKASDILSSSVEFVALKRGRKRKHKDSLSEKGNSHNTSNNTTVSSAPEGATVSRDVTSQGTGGHPVTGHAVKPRTTLSQAASKRRDTTFSVACGNWHKLKRKLYGPEKRQRLKSPEEAQKPKMEKKQEPSPIWFDGVDDILIQASQSEAPDQSEASAQIEDRTQIEAGRARPSEVRTARGQGHPARGHGHTERSPQGVSKDGSDAKLVKSTSFQGVTRAVAMDCEMVGVGLHGDDNALARVSVVNQYGHTLLDTFVKVTDKVVDYRTKVSGVRPENLRTGRDFWEVQKEVADILTGRVLVGHSIKNDLKVLYLDHPRKDIRDTAHYRPFRKLFNGRTPSLKNLSAAVLNVPVQQGEHSSVQDAQAAMKLYALNRKQWESRVKVGRNRKRLQQQVAQLEKQVAAQVDREEEDE